MTMSNAHIDHTLGPSSVSAFTSSRSRDASPGGDIRVTHGEIDESLGRPIA